MLSRYESHFPLTWSTLSTKMLQNLQISLWSTLAFLIPLIVGSPGFLPIAGWCLAFEWCEECRGVGSNWGSQNLGRKAYVAPIYRDDAEDSHSAFTFDLGFSKGASQHPLSYLFCLIRMQLESSDVPGVVSVLTDCCTNLLRKFGGSTFRGKTGINPGYSGATLM